MCRAQPASFSSRSSHIAVTKQHVRKFILHSFSVCTAWPARYQTKLTRIETPAPGKLILSGYDVSLNTHKIWLVISILIQLSK